MAVTFILPPVDEVGFSETEREVEESTIRGERQLKLPGAPAPCRSRTFFLLLLRPIPDKCISWECGRGRPHKRLWARTTLSVLKHACGRDARAPRTQST